MLDKEDKLMKNKIEEEENTNPSIIAKVPMDIVMSNFDKALELAKKKNHCKNKKMP